METKLCDRFKEIVYGCDFLKESIFDHLNTVQGQVFEMLLVGGAGSGKSHIARSYAKTLNCPCLEIELAAETELSFFGNQQQQARLIQQLDLHPRTVVLFKNFDQVFYDPPPPLLASLQQFLESRQLIDRYTQQQKSYPQAILFFTAQETENISCSFLERLEVQHLPCYSRQQKLAILKKFILPQLHDELSLSWEPDEETLRFMINHYGTTSSLLALKVMLRQLLLRHERNSKAKLAEIFGAPLNAHRTYKNSGVPGIVTGVAWNEDGGCLLPIEVVLGAGEGNLTSTGKLGEVMKESIQVALLLARGIALQHGLKAEFFESQDIHLHFPENSIPKDGPSAGLSIFITLLSAFFKQPISPRSSFSGEVTLLSNLLPVGGVQEKILILEEEGFEELWLPEENRLDYQHLPHTPRLKVHFIETAEELAKQIFKEIWER